MEYATTTMGHVKEIAVLASVLAIMGAFVLVEWRRKKNAPKPRGATKI
jgi:hypothetical protein|uniref:Plasma membrane calcium-transporting ATPase 1 protein, STRUCTURAL PROTEIN n=1 Tax=Myoviridae sp. ctshb19 TaxID=2825194 RepID=A0A8S5UGK7_9CAUD|nr:MAG TPA: Plasma membrane calcium-transporting ATPase 1 protein, STRUCTURAL PROTEIN [Myoviridae sp. ctshb19]